VQLQLGNTPASLKAYNDGLVISRTLAEADKDNAQAQRDLMASHYKLGLTRRAFGDYLESAREFESAAVVLSEMIRRKQLLSFAQPAKKDMEQHAAKMHLMGIALGEWAPLFEQPPQSLPALLDSRAIEFASRKDFVTATQAAGKLRELDNADNGNLYNAACVFALAAASVQPTEGEELSKQQSEQRQKWINEAMTTLKQAVEAGWTDFAHMQKDTDLTILRELPEFKALGESDAGEKPE
ncbi:MAG: hypothetical protein AB8G99_20925, partial [Planctomycetaceae bacterium]